MDMVKLNCFSIDPHLKFGKILPSAFFTNATQEEFKELLDNFISENEAKDDREFNAGLFTSYVQKNGYYIMTLKRKVLLPSV